MSGMIVVTGSLVDIVAADWGRVFLLGTLGEYGEKENLVLSLNIVSPFAAAPASLSIG